MNEPIGFVGAGAGMVLPDYSDFIAFLSAVETATVPVRLIESS